VTSATEGAQVLTASSHPAAIAPVGSGLTAARTTGLLEVRSFFLDSESAASCAVGASALGMSMPMMIRIWRTGVIMRCVGDWQDSAHAAILS